MSEQTENRYVQIVVIEGKSFCFTGRSPRMKREFIEIFVEGFGGIFHKGVTQGTDYLVLCDGGSKRWKYGTYGEKLLKALKLAANGGIIRIINERDFWNNLWEITDKRAGEAMKIGA